MTNPEQPSMIGLVDDGTLDTVVQCFACEAQGRYNFDPSNDEDYDAFVAWAIADFDAYHECEEPEPDTSQILYEVSAYEIDRAYGGPEEGGWWYDTGVRVRSLRVVRGWDRAAEYCRRWNHLIRLVQRGKRNVGSVIYAGGRFEAQVYQSPAPSSYPEVRPHYE